MSRKRFKDQWSGEYDKTQKAKAALKAHQRLFAQRIKDVYDEYGSRVASYPHPNIAPTPDV